MADLAKILLVVNPISGGVDKNPFLKKAEKLCHKYGIAYHVFKTTGKNDDVLLAKEIERFGPTKVAACGGDGTTLFVANVLFKKSIPLGIVPLGSANGMAIELFVNADPIQALIDILLSQKVAPLDMITVNKNRCIHIGDCGVNARLVANYEADNNRGMATYAKYFLQELGNSEPFSMVIDVSGKQKSYTGFMLAICNARKFGTGIPLNGNGNPMDGKFELVIIENIDARTLLSAGLAKFDESFLSPKNATVIQAEKARVTFTKPQLLQLDGEVMGDVNELEIRIEAGVIPFVTHNENTYLPK